MQQDWIEPERFAMAMEKHWIQNLGNVSSAPLRQTWRWMGHYFRMHLLDHDNPDRRHKWYILSPPTGAGKTQGAIIYCAMLSVREPYDHPGALIVTRRIVDCEEIAKQINKYGRSLGGRETAIAYHTGNSGIPAPNIDLNDLRLYPILVITHQAYVKAFEAIEAGDSKGNKLEQFLTYQIGERKLRIIDECLDIIQSFNSSLDGLRQTLGIIPQKLRDKFPDDINALQFIIGMFEKIHERAKKCKSVQDMVLVKEPPKVGTPPDFLDLVKAIKEEGLDDQHIHEERLRALAEIVKTWIYYHNDRGNHTMHSAKLLVPNGVHRGCVVMDATAYVNRVYEIHDDSEIKKPPEGSRNYRNVTIHVSKGHNVGKKSMRANASTLMPQLIDSLRDRLKGKKVFGVCHKDVEPFLAGTDPEDFKLLTEHWHNLDGSNEFRDCQACVIAGLPYLPDTWTANVFMAMQGVQSTDWLRAEGNRPWGKYPDIRKALKLGRMSADIVQAINRIRSRKVINEHGDCDPADVYILLPANVEESETILQDISAMMPGVAIKDDWDFKVQKRQSKQSNKEIALLTYLKNMSDGVRENRSHVENLTKIPRRTMNRLIARAKDNTSELHGRLESLKVKIDTIREGRSLRTYFVKDSFLFME